MTFVFSIHYMSRYSPFFSLSLNFTMWSAGTAKLTILYVLAFLLIIMRSGHLAEIRGYVCISKSQRSLCVSFSRTDSGLCIYHSFVWLNLNFLHSSKEIPLPSQSYLVLYYFCNNLLYSLFIWMIVSSLSPHNRQLPISCVLSILALIWLVLSALFCAAIIIIIIIIPRSFFHGIISFKIFWREGWHNFIYLCQSYYKFPNFIRWPLEVDRQR